MTPLCRIFILYKTMKFVRNSKLSDWCLRVIIENLDKFIYSKTVPQRQIDFLLRLYSEEIFHEYSSLNSITEDCMLWFLNPHSKKITLPSITDNIVKQLQIVGSTITSLNLRASLASENMLNSIICCIPCIKFLNLNYTSCSDKTLLCLKRMCPDLTTLYLRECENVSDDGMKILSDSNLLLEDLDIIDTSVQCEGICYIIKGIPSLKSLKFYNLADIFCSVHESEYITGAYIHFQYNLTELLYDTLLSGYDPLNVIQMWTVMCPKVRKVHILFPVDEEVLHACTKFQHLEEISISMTFDNEYKRIADVLIPISPLANNLRALTLSHVKVSTISLIETFKNIDYLCLINVYFTEFDEKDIKITETKLLTLMIKDTNFEFPTSTYKAIALLVSLSKNVTELHLNRISAIPEEIFQIISNSMKCLSFLDLSFCNVKVSSIFHFFQIPSMHMMFYDLCNHQSFYSDFKKFLNQDSLCTVQWRIMTDNSDDSDSDILMSDSDT